MVSRLTTLGCKVTQFDTQWHRAKASHVFCLMKVGVSVRTVIATRQGRLCLSPKALPTIFFTVTSFLLVQSIL